jgi:hypothetical protein
MRLVYNHARVATIFGFTMAGIAVALAALIGFGVLSTAKASAATSSKLPDYVQVWHFRYRSGPNGAPCVLIGTVGHKHVGAVCRNGKAYRLPDGTKHNAPIALNALPPWIHSWGGGRSVVIGGGNADTTLQLRIGGGVSSS